jgi:2-polyprenyl-3-methyl-5-hydroxy-6-metoxy-1,4-benzoquinol methylase
VRCSICLSASKTYTEVYDDRYGHPGRFDVHVCLSCGHKFIAGDLSAVQFDRLYSDFYPRSTLDVERYRPAPEMKGLSAWLKGGKSRAYSWVPEKVRVLDVGCGFGESLGYHEARGCDAYGVDADENAGRVAERYNFKVRVGLFDPSVYDPEFFDYVTMDQVLEHMADPVGVLRGVARILRPRGTAIVSMPNANGLGAAVFGGRWVHWHAPYHLHFFSVDSLRSAAEKAGLCVEGVRSITNSEWLKYQWIHLATRPKEGTPSPFWAVTADPVPWRKKAVGLLNLLHRTRVNHVLTRILDAVSLGDNHVFWLRKP